MELWLFTSCLKVLVKVNQWRLWKHNRALTRLWTKYYELLFHKENRLTSPGTIMVNPGNVFAIYFIARNSILSITCHTEDINITYIEVLKLQVTFWKALSVFHCRYLELLTLFKWFYLFVKTVCYFVTYRKL